ncbi:alpha/beta hydrolase [Hyalangium sp.]|uniref:alpha/beta hydrolase n=1 Tax=Hyalangium sp. TaxID=2028555 RepID=UPI002D3B59AE|nr:alpha/beta hydrolase [Hyalangium sp.]HYI03070.1 alpha/beta hydrolase [Hyalangium sp.]
MVLLSSLLSLALAASPTPTPEPRISQTEVDYVEGEGADPVKHTLDIFQPEGQQGLPVLLFFHGGVWQRGDKSAYTHVGQALARRGIVTVVVNYRLTPTVRHPGHVQDAARAAGWVLENVERFGGRRDRVFLSGHSAGGHLVTLLLFDPSYLKAVGHAPEELAGVIALSGVFDLTRPIDDTPEGGFESFIFPPFGQDKAARLAASPLSHLRAVRPPLLVLLAGEDYKDMRQQSRDFVAALKARKLPVSFLTVPGRGHFELIQRLGTDKDPTTEHLVRFVSGKPLDVR